MKRKKNIFSVDQSYFSLGVLLFYFIRDPKPVSRGKNIKSNPVMTPGYQKRSGGRSLRKIFFSEKRADRPIGKDSIKERTKKIIREAKGRHFLRIKDAALGGNDIKQYYKVIDLLKFRESPKKLDVRELFPQK